VSPFAELAFGIGAGVGFGVVFILFSESSAGSGMWPVLAARASSVPALLVGLLALRRSLLPRRRDATAVASAGVLDLSANALILLAVRRGLISLVAPVAALYPAATVLLARVVVGEKLGRTRLGGLALALTGLVLIAAR
jgi:drug/metabolite transporter (DMT)-like permease